METTVEEESPTKRKLTIEVTADEVAPHYEEAIKRLARQVKVPGFRPGKAPKSVIESRLGKEAIKDELLREALPTFYAQAAKDQSIKPVTQPEIDVTSFEDGEPLQFTALVEIRPEITLPEYKGLEVSRPAWKATPEEVDSQVDHLRNQFGTLDPVSRNATKGDYVTIDLFAKIHDEDIPSLSNKDVVYEVGSEGFAPEMDKELEGKRTGDILKFNAKVPQRAAIPHAGEEATFQVVVKQVQAKKLPALDDEFAKLASEFDTLDELKEELTKRIESVKKQQADMVTGERIIADLMDRVEIPTPEALVATETEARLARLIRELERVGMTIEQYLEQNEGTEEDLVKGAKEAAEKTVATDLVLETVAANEGIEVDDKSLAIEVAALAQHTNRDAKELMTELAESGRVNVIAGDILRRKALNFLVENATVTDEQASSDASKE